MCTAIILALIRFVQIRAKCNLSYDRRASQLASALCDEGERRDSYDTSFENFSHSQSPVTLFLIFAFILRTFLVYKAAKLCEENLFYVMQLYAQEKFNWFIVHYLNVLTGQTFQHDKAKPIQRMILFSTRGGL